MELRHRQRARAEDRIRAARATGLRNLPLHDAAQNQFWLEIVQLALELLAWMPMPMLTGAARRGEPRRLRLQLFSAAAQLVTTGRHRILRLAQHWPFTDVITSAWPGSMPSRTPADQWCPVPTSSIISEPWKPALTRRDSRAINLPRQKSPLRTSRKGPTAS